MGKITKVEIGGLDPEKITLADLLQLAGVEEKKNGTKSVEEFRELCETLVNIARPWTEEDEDARAVLVLAVDTEHLDDGCFHFSRVGRGKNLLALMAAAIRTLADDFDSSPEELLENISGAIAGVEEHENED